MNYDLRVEGFCMDDELKEELLLRCRRVVLGVEPGCPVAVSIRQVEGRVQGRIEITLPGRKVSAVVWRSDALSAMDSAAQAVMDAVGSDGDARGFVGSGFQEAAFSTLQ